MSSNPFHVHDEIASLYETAAVRGRIALTELQMGLRDELPIPEPWWTIPLLMSLGAAECDGAQPLMSPEEFRRLDILGSPKRSSYERQQGGAFAPYLNDRPGYRALFDGLIECTLRLAAEERRYDDQIMPLVGQMLRQALNADPCFEISNERVRAIQDLIDRNPWQRCPPMTPETKRGRLTLEKILDGVREDAASGIIRDLSSDVGAG